MKKNAVTFIELLVALSIFSVIAVAVYSSFNAGTFTWRRLTESADTSGKAAIVLKLMADEISSYIPSKADTLEKLDMLKLEGSQTSISFLSVSAKKGIDAVNKVTYSYDSQSGYITRTRQALKSLLDEAPAENPAVENLCSGVKALEFKYLYKKEGPHSGAGSEDEYEEANSTRPDAKTPCVAVGIHIVMANNAGFDRIVPFYVLPEEQKS
jgi:prepilin-type N-terminal cleavage/methylation domain-containing protein